MKRKFGIIAVIFWIIAGLFGLIGILSYVWSMVICAFFLALISFRLWQWKPRPIHVPTAGMEIVVNSEPYIPPPPRHLPEGDPLDLEQIGKIDRTLRFEIEQEGARHGMPQFFRMYNTFAVTWSHDNDWVSIFATPKNKQEYKRYGFNVSEWRWSYGENAYGALEIKRQLEGLFEKLHD